MDYKAMNESIQFIGFNQDYGMVNIYVTSFKI